MRKRAANASTPARAASCSSLARNAGSGRNARNAPPFDHCVDVKWCAADEQRQAFSSGDVRDGGHRQILIAGQRHVAFWRENVDQVVRHGVALGQIWLGHPDVEATVEVPRVGVDDFSAERESQFDAESGLTDRGRTADDHAARERVTSLDVVPR